MTLTNEYTSISSAKEIPRFKRYWTKDQMIQYGADGYLDRAVLMEIPLSKIEGREPVPAMEGGYIKGTGIIQPIEVVYQPQTDTYILHSGNHRVTQAEMNGQIQIMAFVEPEDGNFRRFRTKGA